MQRIHQSCSGSIAQACASSPFPPEFLGALTANESAGAKGTARFEPAVYAHLRAVACGEAAAFGGICAEDLDQQAEMALEGASVEPQPPRLALRPLRFHARYLTSSFLEGNRSALAALEDEILRQLATSWSYTQIMGYHVVGRQAIVRDLLDPQFHYALTVELLTEFAADFRLDPAMEFEELFRCWNTGRPYGKTHDPAYVENGLRRMKIYRALLHPPDKQAIA